MAKLSFRFGSMNVGKSTLLLQINHNYRESGMKTLLLTAAIDNRGKVGYINSRLGASAPATVFDENTDMIKLWQQTDEVACILIDEAQFMSPHQVRQLHKIVAQHGVPVIAFGLRTDFKGEPFPGATYLLALAEELVEMKAICRCGAKSTMNQRLNDAGQTVIEGDQVQIGGNTRYRQMCSRCFYEATEAANLLNQASAA